MAEKIKNISASHIEHIRGNYHVGDIYNTVTKYDSGRKKIQFEPLTASVSLFNDYPRPHFLDQLFDIVKTEQLLLLGGNGRFDKGRLLKYVALQLRSEELEIKECSEFDNFANLREAIRAEAKRNIFILYNLTAEAITYQFEDLRSLIREKSHIVLTSTDTTYDSWMFHEDKPNPCWFSVPEQDIYSKETLQTHLESAMTNRRLTLAIPSGTVVERLSTIEQIDIFLDQVLRSEKPDDPAALQTALELSVRNDFSWLEPWFLSLNKINRQIVIGLTLFDGAYEKQVFAGYERILNASWRRRNPELRSIDLEDLIPLRAYFKTEGRFISGTLEGQRKRILGLAWRSHKHAILSAIPVLLDIIEESNDPAKYDVDLFGTGWHRERIREVLAATLSDIGLVSYEDIHHPLLVLASSGDQTIQLVTADVLSRWLPFQAEKTYEVLDYWQKGTAAELLSRSGSASREKEKEKQQLTNIRGAIVLTLCYMAWYDKTNALSSRVKDLLEEFIEYNEGALVERMQFAVEKITSRHPESMNRLLREKILQHSYYIAPASKGLVIAYNNGQAAAVRQILEEWIGAVKKMEDHPEDRERFEERECLLATIVFTLKNIDYSAGEKAFTIADAYAILEDFRTHNHNTHIRKFLLDAIVELLDVMFHSSESLSIQLIPNIDAKEREYIVQEFRRRYLAQREELKGGDYLMSIADREFSTWSDPALRPITPLETMLNKWKAGKNTILTQIALQSFVEFQDIEGIEKKAIDGYLGILQKEEKELEKKKAEFEKKGLPVYEGAIKPGVEAEAFVKVCAPFVESSRLELLRNMYAVALHEDLKDEGTDRFIRLLDDKEEGMVKKVTYLYKLFRNGSFKPEDNPVRSNIQSRLFLAMATLTVPSKARARFRAFAPILLTTPSLSFDERAVIFNKIKPHQQTWLRLSFTLTRYPLLLLLLVVFIFYLFNKIF